MAGNDSQDDSAGAPEPAAPAGNGPRRPSTRTRRFSAQLAALLRWLHIYASMLGLAIVLFFSATGLTLNHPDWFFAHLERRTTDTAKLPLPLLGKPTLSDTEHGPATPGDVSKLEIVERLRATHHVRGALTEFRIDEYECLVMFKGPGYAADAFIDRETGRYEIAQTFHGPVAILNDLHKGRDSGPVWSIVIDVSAVLLTFISITGLTLLFYLKLRRVSGLIVCAIGTAAVVALAYWLVP
jgi:hypothetical protein